MADLTALATTGALVVSLSIFGVQLRDRARSQASKVSAAASHGASQTHTDGIVQIAVVVTNASDAPIFDVEATALGHKMPSGELLNTLPAGQEDIRRILVRERHFSQMGSRVGVEFRDAAGRRWVRLPNGRLRRRRRLEVLDSVSGFLATRTSRVSGLIWRRLLPKLWAETARKPWTGEDGN